MDYRYLLGGNLLLDLEKEENFGKEVFLEEPLAYLADALQNHQKDRIQESLETIKQRIMESRVNKSAPACIFSEYFV